MSNGVLTKTDTPTGVKKSRVEVKSSLGTGWAAYTRRERRGRKVKIKTRDHAE